MNNFAHACTAHTQILKTVANKLILFRFSKGTVSDLVFDFPWDYLRIFSGGSKKTDPQESNSFTSALINTSAPSHIDLLLLFIIVSLFSFMTALRFAVIYDIIFRCHMRRVPCSPFLSGRRFQLVAGVSNLFSPSGDVAGVPLGLIWFRFYRRVPMMISSAVFFFFCSRIE